MHKSIALLLLFLGNTYFGYSQILDDSTKLVYSAKTTQTFSLSDIENNTGKRTDIDTSILNIHQYNFFYKNGVLYQDLGNFGTPLNRIYYTAPNALGKQIGINSLIDYSYDIESSSFFDTKSPYTKLYYIQGTKGQQSMEVAHAQNIKPNWNAGFSLKRMISLKQIGVAERQEKQMSHYSFLAHTSYFSKDKRYAFLFNLNIFQHQQSENGGIFVDSAETKNDIYDYKLEKVQLYSVPKSSSNTKNVRSYDRRSNFRFYNEYALIPNKSLQVFHQFDYQTNFIRYDDDYLYSTVATNQNATYYPNVLYDTLASHDRIVYEAYHNKVGLKGSINKLFYKGYYKRRDFQYRQEKYEHLVQKYTEHYVGGQIEYRFSDTTSVALKSEYLVGNDYLLDGSFRSKFVDLNLNQTYYSPSLYQLHNSSNNYRWNNNFNNTRSTQLQIKGKLETKNIHLHPWASYNIVDNLIYYDVNASPTQDNGTLGITTLGLNSHFHWKILHFEDQVRYTTVTGNDIYRVPELFNQAKLYVYGPLFKKALLLQLGVDLYWKSTYFANAYAPGTFQFHLSDKSNEINNIDGYLLADVFLNAQIKRAYIFLKLSHANQGLPSAGYQITPYYSGLPRSFEFGINWMFYD